MKKSHRMCAVMLDTMGREIGVKVSHEGPEDGWTTQEKTYEVDAGDTVAQSINLLF